MLNGIGALPLLGKVTTPFKLAKGVRTIEKVSDAVKGVNKTIDTLPELIPGVRRIAENVQSVTSKIPEATLPKNWRLRKNYNLNADVLNAGNSIGDILGNFNIQNDKTTNPTKIKLGLDKNFPLGELNFPIQFPLSPTQFIK